MICHVHYKSDMFIYDCIPSMGRTIIMCIFIDTDKYTVIYYILHFQLVILYFTSSWFLYSLLPAGYYIFQFQFVIIFHFQLVIYYTFQIQCLLYISLPVCDYIFYFQLVIIYFTSSWLLYLSLPAGWSIFKIPRNPAFMSEDQVTKR